MSYSYARVMLQGRLEVVADVWHELCKFVNIIVKVVLLIPWP
jgi:hypothetical protein